MTSAVFGFVVRDVDHGAIGWQPRLSYLTLIVFFRLTCAIFWIEAAAGEVHLPRCSFLLVQRRTQNPPVFPPANVP